jgi:hypothetical protein
MVGNEELCDFADKFDDLILMSGTISDSLIEKCPIDIEAIMTFQEAIELKCIVDYRVWLPFCKTNPETGESYVNLEIPHEINHIVSECDRNDNRYVLTLKAVFLSNMMILHGSRRTIVFL